MPENLQTMFNLYGHICKEENVGINVTLKMLLYILKLFKQAVIKAFYLLGQLVHDFVVDPSLPNKEHCL